MSNTMNEAQTCPRRVTEIGPWKQEPNLDHWQKVGIDRVCSFCGSLHPEVRNASEGAIKFYKWHVSDDPDWLARIEAIWPAVMEKHAAHLRRVFGIGLPASGDTGEATE